MSYTTKRLGPNEVEITNEDQTLTILVSYETPVAYRNAHGQVVRTKTRFSRSTEKHIRDFQNQANSGLGECLQEHLDQVMLETTGNTRLKGASVSKPYRTTNLDYDSYTEQGDKNLAFPPNRRRR